MNINATNALIRLLTVLVAGMVAYALYQLVPDATIKNAAVLLIVAVIASFEQIIKTQ